MAHVKEGDSVKQGQLLLEFDKEQIAREYPTITPVMVTNVDDYTAIEGLYGMNADQSTTVIKIR